MALTVTYSFDSVLGKTPVPTFAGLSGSNSDTVGLSGGGWATSATDSDGFSDISFYDATGTVIGSNYGFGSAGGRLAQLTNGNVVVVGSPSAGAVNFAIDGPTGGGVTSGQITSSTNESNADVAALTGGGFVVVDQYAFTAPDHDIEVYVRDAGGNAVNSFAVTGSADDDENASVAGLNDGGFAVAFDRTDTSGNSTMWYAVYNADGSTRLGPTELDGAGTINKRPNVTALKSGGFAIGYQDNGWDSTQPDTTVATLDANGIFQTFVRGSTLTSDDSEVSVTTLSNGMVMSTFTNNFNNGGDLDIRGTLIDPVTGVALTDVASPFDIDFSGDHTTVSSVSATGLAQFAVSYTNSTTGAVDVEAFQLKRTVTGTSAGDSFTGDDAVNDVSGLGGDDTLKGGANRDILKGGTGNDTLMGFGGNDTLSGGGDNDVLNGGTGFDTATYNTSTTGVNVDLSISGPQNTHDSGNDTFISVENVTGGSSSDHLTGSSVFNTIIGGAGNDFITGGGSHDTLFGGTGADTFIYNALSDSIGASRDRISDFTSQDTFDLSAIDANSTVAGDQAFDYIGAAHFSGVAGQLDISHVGANTYLQGDVNGDKVKDFQIQILGNVSVTDANLVK